MASSNRHWPSMFKSKPCNNQWQHHDIISSSCHKTPFNNNQVTGPCEERTPEPKPRWNPRPEQIRILESIFNSGMVNPPRDEIRKIRVQLQEYGQVGDANVFYWFQNRKSRSKHKQRQLQTTKSGSNHTTPPTSMPAPVVTVASTSSSTSSNKSSSSPNSAEKSLSVGSTANVMDLLNSPTCSVNQPFFTTTGPNDFLTEPFFFPVQKNVGSDVLGQGFCFPNDQSVENCSPSFLLSELMLMSQSSGEKKDDDDDGKMKLQTHQVSYGGTSNAVDCNVGHSTIVPQSTSLPIPNPTSYIYQGVADIGPTNKSTVFINDVCFEVGLGPFNVREAFGDDAVLFHSSGQPVLTNDWGLSLHPLQHGAFYYLLRASPDLRTIDLI